jgi:mycoredoxin-dependent peroxiredoxin
LSLYRDNAGKLSAVSTAVLGISVDSVWANKAFHDQLGIDFPVLSDFKHEVARRYGVLDEEAGVARRTTFVIDSEGIVQHIDQGSDALDPAGAIGACSVLQKR